MRSVSAKHLRKMLDLTREYYSDVWREDEGNKSILEERISIANQLENETSVSWLAWVDFVNSAYGLSTDVTDDEAFCALRVLGFSPEDEHE